MKPIGTGDLTAGNVLRVLDTFDAICRRYGKPPVGTAVVRHDLTVAALHNGIAHIELVARHRNRVIATWVGVIGPNGPGKVVNPARPPSRASTSSANFAVSVKFRNESGFRHLLRGNWTSWSPRHEERLFGTVFGVPRKGKPATIVTNGNKQLAYRLTLSEARRHQLHHGDIVRFVAQRDADDILVARVLHKVTTRAA